MFAGFKYQSVPLDDIMLDDRNPRIVMQTKLSSQQEILSYLFEHEDLEPFIRKIATEGKNPGAERPYVVKAKGSKYTVVEGNTRIAAYKVLTGLMKPAAGEMGPIPHLSEATKKNLLSVDCSIAPDRDSLLPIMANAHFGMGDKSRWGYLGSRKAVYDEWKIGKSIALLARVFDRTQGQIRELILEYLLYLEALKLSWNKDERSALLNPSLEFNPPVRFLQTSGHKQKIGIDFDHEKLKVILPKGEATKKFKHLLNKLVISPSKGLGATATYEQVFEDYSSSGAGRENNGKSSAANATSSSSRSSKSRAAGTQINKEALFVYPVTIPSALVKQLMKEAGDIKTKRFPASATFLLRNIVETLLKHIIDQQKANPASKALDLEGALNLCMSNGVNLPQTDKKVLKEFHKTHLSYLNLGAHGNVIPNSERCFGARDAIDQFIMKYI